MSSKSSSKILIVFIDMYAHLYTANITVFSNIIYDIACYVLFIMILCRRAFRVKQKEKKYEYSTYSV